MAKSAVVDPDTATENGKRGRPVGVPNIPSTFRGLTPVQKLPERSERVSQGEIRNALDQIKDQGLTGQPFELQTWGEDERSNRAAHTKASGLRKKYPEADGWTIRVGASEVEPGRVGLFVQYG